MEAFARDYLPHYTYDDYKHWEGNWEIIEGVVYAMAPLPVIKHQRISRNINYQLVKLLEGCDTCEAMLPVDWKISEDTVVQPDNMVVCGETDGKYLDRPPVMIFEILSSSTREKDKNLKFKLYEMQKVKYYIIVDIDAGIAEVYENIENRYKKLKNAVKDIILFTLQECEINFNFSLIWDKTT